MKVLQLLSCLWIAHGTPTITTDSDGSYKHGQFVTVEYNGVEEADRASCWYGLFFYGANLSYAGEAGFPATPPFLVSAPIKFAPCGGTSFQQTGAGKESVHLLAYRQPLELALFTGGSGQKSVPRLLARSGKPLTAVDAAEPRHPRLAWTSTKKEMRLTWSSMEPHPTFATLAVKSGDSKASQQPLSTVATYTADSLCSYPANSSGFADPGFHHSVVFSGLTPSVYAYSVGSLSGTFEIKDEEKYEHSIRIGVIADVGATALDGMEYHWPTPNASATYNFTLARNPDLVLHLGDLSYATGYAGKWDMFLDQMTPLSGRVPYMTALGNHEQDWWAELGFKPHALYGSDSGGECAIPTYTRFPMPATDQGSGWYQFTQGPVAFVIFNSEWNVTAGSRQYDWIHGALANIDRNATPWIVVGCHRPMYTGNAPDPFPGDGILGREDLEDLLKEFEVDFMMYGHVHNAQRTCPVYRSKCTSATTPGGFPGTVHAVIGNGGMGLTAFPSAQAPWSLFQYYGYGFNELEVNRTTAVLRFFGDYDGKLLDETTYTRPFPRPTKVQDSQLVV